MNRYERHMLAQKLAALKAEEAARRKMEAMLGKREAERRATEASNREAARDAENWPVFFDYDYASFFDAPMRRVPDPQRNQT